MRSPLLLAALSGAALSLAACAAAPPPPAPPPEPAAASAKTAEPAPAPEMAPTPYTADEIREGCPAGRHIVFRVKEPDKPDIVRTVDFLKSDADGADIRTVDTDPSGKVLHTEDTRATWDDLRRHAEFPKDSVVVTQRMTVHPLGTLDTFVYKVTRGSGPDEEVTTFHFAKKYPGPPVLYFTDKAGKRVKTTTMESTAK
ncbi:MAG: hypothetical protein R3B70_12830 [Polyangiaceae bacterium]